MRTLIGIILFLTIIIAGIFTIIPKEDRDHINPFIPEEQVYVQINKAPVSNGPRYEYTLTGYNKDGEEREVTFSSGKVLKEQAYLKITAKGSFVEEWEEVQGIELPEKVKHRLSE